MSDPEFTINDVLVGNPDDGQVAPGVLAEAVVPAGEHWSGVDVVAADRALAARAQDQHLGREFGSALR